MYREHIVQFGVGIDEDVIMERVYNSAEKAITEELKQEFKRVIFDTDRWGNRSGLTDWMQEKLDEFLAENRDVIIEKATALLVDKMSRMKVVKEAAAEVAKAV